MDRSPYPRDSRRFSRFRGALAGIRADGAAAQILIVTMVAIMIVVQVTGFLYTTDQQSQLIVLRAETREMRIAQQALVDSQNSVTDYVLTGDAGYLQSFYAASRILTAERSTTLRQLDEVANPRFVGHGQRPALIAIDKLDGTWRTTIDVMKTAGAERARAALFNGEAEPALAEVRSSVSRYLDIKNARGAEIERQLALGGRIVLALQLIGGALTIIGLLLSFRLGAKASAGRRAAMNEAVGARHQVERLFQMTDMLQSATTHDDAKAVLLATVNRLLPEFGGALYIFNNSGDRLDLSTSWEIGEDDELPRSIAPTGCWALKRGKTHLNLGGHDGLQCTHHASSGAALEVPMMARGEVYGLLELRYYGAEAEARFAAEKQVITAIADSMSMALANIALREKLRNQALRDPLTGLYNRRYMEDMLERFVNLSERSERPLSVIMIDLDHFKRLNDEHGHAMGDAVLRSAAGAITGGLRQSDIACRYGGEELVVLLPECPLPDATLRAEQLRARIEALSEIHGVRVTASFGVSAYPDTATKVDDLLRTADVALYEAKQGGRNCVALAGPAKAPAKTGASRKTA